MSIGLALLNIKTWKARLAGVTYTPNPYNSGDNDLPQPESRSTDSRQQI